MRILVVGEFRWEIYEKAFYDAFNAMEHETYKFGWVKYFNDSNNFVTSIYSRFQNKYTFGPTIIKINEDLINYCREIKPQIVLIYRGTHIFPSTIKKVSEDSTVFGYNNDDPFSHIYPRYYWRHYINGIKYYDHIFSYRLKNIDDYIINGYNQVSLLRSYYIKSRNYPIEHLEDNKYSSDVMFIGHFENDDRDEYMKLLIDEGIKLKIYGDRESWQKSKYFEILDKCCGPIVQVREDYNLAINSTKIALVFLSKINNDSYTRRCFEIPATKTFMLSEYTEDLSNLFKDGKEAVYFKSKRDFIDKVKFYLNNDILREEISSAGYQRVIKDGHEVKNRIREILYTYNNIIKK